jgi:hypothetical protein
MRVRVAQLAVPTENGGFDAARRRDAPRLHPAYGRKKKPNPGLSVGVRAARPARDSGAMPEAAGEQNKRVVRVSRVLFSEAVELR